MRLYTELSLSDFQAWSGAVSTLERINEKGKADQLEAMLEELYPDGMSDTELNDLLWFDWEEVFEWLGISDKDDDNDEEAREFVEESGAEDFESFCNGRSCTECPFYDMAGECKEHFDRIKAELE